MFARVFVIRLQGRIDVLFLQYHHQQFQFPLNMIGSKQTIASTVWCWNRPPSVVAKKQFDQWSWWWRQYSGQTSLTRAPKRVASLQPINKIRYDHHTNSCDIFWIQFKILWILNLNFPVKVSTRIASRQMMSINKPRIWVCTLNAERILVH